MDSRDVKQGLRVVVVHSAEDAGRHSQRYVGRIGVVADQSKSVPDVRLDCGTVILVSHREIEPLPITEENTVLDTAMALVRTKAAELAEAEQALLALIRECK